jgi:hypothetical protein
MIKHKVVEEDTCLLDLVHQKQDKKRRYCLGTGVRACLLGYKDRFHCSPQFSLLNQ